MKKPVLVLVGLVILPGMARADRVHLENGKTFDDVVFVSQTESQVRFRVASGEMTLPSSWIARVERTPGALKEYLARERELARAPEPSAEAYLALARWARAQGLGHGFRDAVLLAAELQPDLDGLPPLMAKVGYTLDPEGKVWIRVRPAGSTAPSARPDRGGSSDGDRRLPAGPDLASTLEPAVEVAAGLTRAIETLAQAELERSRSPRVSRQARFERTLYPLVSTTLALTAAGWVFPGPPLRPADSDPANPVIRNPANPTARALLARPPGSLLPISAYRH